MDVTEAIQVVAVSDVGLVRPHNEDAVSSDLSNGLVILADGMGGHNSGEIASAMAVLIVTTELASLLANEPAGLMQEKAIPQMLEKAVALANKTIVDTAQEHSACKGMGTTLVAGVFSNNKIVVGHVGDSRMYRLRGDAWLQLTEDHSLLQEEINAGLVRKEDARHARNGHLVTRALGATLNVELALNEYAVSAGDVYLLCSDGLTDLVDDSEVKRTLMHANGDMDLAAKQLLALANGYGGSDNISVLIASVKASFPIA